MRRLCMALLVGILVVAGVPAAAAAPVTVTVNGVPVALPVAPEIVSGTTLVPVRAMAQALGAAVTWDAATHTVNVTTPASPGGAGMDVPKVYGAVKPSIVGIVALQHDAAGDVSAIDTGSGVVIGASGLVVTNDHVIAGADTVYVVLKPGDAVQVPVATIWQDVVSDLAFLRTGIAGLPVAQLADSNGVTVGEPVIAVGNPLGYYLQDTVTRGIISGIGRDVSGASLYPLLQTDASINPGNSGGALVDAAGQVIGITSLKFASTKVQGLGFAIPSNVVQQILGQFQKYGRVVRPWLGVALTEPWQVSVGLPTNAGLTVTQVVAGSPADLAGIQTGDEITAVDGKSVHTNIGLTAVLWAHKPGDTVKVALLRDGQAMTVNVTLAERPAGQ